VDRLGDEVRSELSRFGPQAGMAELLERWPPAVGAAIARNAWPARIARDGTVLVHAADAVWAFELTQRAPEIAERLGVERLKFVPGPLPEATPEAVETPLEPLPEDDERARAVAAPIEDETLRETVQKAVRFALARERHNRPV
jgi:hypothetical protein